MKTEAFRIDNPNIVWIVMSSTRESRDTHLIPVRDNAGPANTSMELESTYWRSSSGTDARPIDESTAAPLERRLRRILAFAEHENLEDGADTSLEENLEAMICKHGFVAIEPLARVVLEEPVNAEVVAFALRCLGRIDHRETHESRRWILERALLSCDSMIRDGASLGLCTLNDPHAIRYLQAAAEREKIPALREDLLLAVRHFETG